MLEWLKTALGDAYTDDIDKKVSEEIGKAFVSKADFKAANEAKKALEAQLAERDTQLEALKKVDAAGLQAQIEALQADNKAAAEKHAAEVQQLRLDTAVETALLKAKAVNTKAVKALLDLSKVEFDGETVKGLDDQIKSIQESDSWAFGTEPAGSTGRPQGKVGTETSVEDAILSTVFSQK